MRQIIVIAHNMRSTHNVGSLLRTCDGLGIQKLYFTGYTPYPKTSSDSRLPHEVIKLTKQINKTALGAEDSMSWDHAEDICKIIAELQDAGYEIVALEQADSSEKLPEYKPSEKLVLITGREVEGLEPEILALCDTTIEIPMFGAKESFNVVQAAAMALYHCRFFK